MQCVEERSGSAVDARQLLSALDAFKKGDFSVRLSANGGVAGKVAEAFNEVVELNECLVGATTCGVNVTRDGFSAGARLAAHRLGAGRGRRGLRKQQAR
jgi:hypothetical protein